MTEKNFRLILWNNKKNICHTCNVRKLLSSSTNYLVSPDITDNMDLLGLIKILSFSFSLFLFLSFEGLIIFFYSLFLLFFFNYIYHAHISNCKMEREKEKGEKKKDL